MKFAIVEGLRKEATPKSKGTCPNCNSLMVARCGKVNAWHWGHKGNPPCDPWWEAETIWHRNWKNKFPLECQEIIQFDAASGEKHVADVKTPHGLVLEFQHSVISIEEIQSRELFYDNMIWIVDGMRGEMDSRHFNFGIGGVPVQKNPVVYSVSWCSRSKLLHTWSYANKPVYFDFGEDILWRILVYKRDEKVGGFSPTFKEVLVEECNNGQKISTTKIE